MDGRPRTGPPASMLFCGREEAVLPERGSGRILCVASGEETMLRNTRVQMLLVLVTGAVVGYVAAGGRINPFPSASAAPSGGPAASEPTANSQSQDRAACCPDGGNKGQL